MKGDKEFTGTLLGFDDYVNMVLEDVTEYETTSEGKVATKLDQILLNGTNICMVCSFWMHDTLSVADAFLPFLSPFAHPAEKVDSRRQVRKHKCSQSLARAYSFLYSGPV
ncbi:hypothetical protein CcCBS67573_g01864 [Chytriomyces confervae]|uniref:LSM complex subunit LSM5 n=1 Tax=Chytriomyces confervae TaxID=246404 RepID=A0A507FKL3_9FUNG|nr:hypothetical protein CcCBS67573_g01864 [Chytriomyces confervae]